MPTGSFNVEETGAVRLRSLLFVPGDSEKKLAKAVHIEADVLIVDLEDSVAPERRDTARELTFQFLRTHNRSIWVRINPLESEDANRRTDDRCQRRGHDPRYDDWQPRF